MSRIFRSATYTSFCLVLCSLALSSSSLSTFAAAASASCVCSNGGTPNEALISASADPSNDCICDCPSGYLAPLCNFESSDQVKVLVLWHNTTDHVFSAIEKRKSLQAGFTGSTNMDLLPVATMPGLIPSDLETVVAATTNNAGENIVPFLYVITGTYASQLLLDSLKPTASQPTYLSSQLCLGARQVGIQVAPLGRYATDLLKSKVIGSNEVTLTITVGSGTSSRASTSKQRLEVTQMDAEFFIATIVIMIIVAILGALEHRFFHPESQEGDEECVACGVVVDGDNEGMSKIEAGAGTHEMDDKFGSVPMQPIVPRFTTVDAVPTHTSNEGLRIASHSNAPSRSATVV